MVLLLTVVQDVAHHLLVAGGDGVVQQSAAGGIQRGQVGPPRVELLELWGASGETGRRDELHPQGHSG